MTPKIRKRLIEEMRKATFASGSFFEDIVSIVEKVLKEDGCYHTYERGRCPHDGCSNHRENLKEGEEKTNGACVLGKHEKCPHLFEKYECRCPCHTPSSAKVELPEKIDEVLTLNYLTLKNKLNEVIDYLSAKEKEHGN